VTVHVNRDKCSESRLGLLVTVGEEVRCVPGIEQGKDLPSL
jgi:hypothetical protein